MANIITGNQLSLPASTELSINTNSVSAPILSGLHKGRPNAITFFFDNRPIHTPTIDFPTDYAGEIGVQTNTKAIKYKVGDVMDTVKDCIGSIYNTPACKAINKHVIATSCKFLHTIIVKGKKTVLKTYTPKQIEAELKLKVPFRGVKMQLNPDVNSRHGLQSKIPVIVSSVREAVAADKEFAASILSLNNKNLLPAVLQTNHTSKTDDLLAEMGEIVITVLERFLHGAQPNFISTITEEVLRQLYPDKCGIHMWDEAKKRAELSWQTGDEEKKFLEEIKNFADENGEISINVVCHSVGAIVGCEFIKAVTAKRSANIRIANIILLAPACTFRLFDDSVMKGRALRENFRMFTMREQYEETDVFIEGVYTQSPLYLISGLLENKYNPKSAILGLEKIRRVRPHENNMISSIHEYLEGNNNAGRVVYAVTPKREIPTGHECTATSHEDFLQDPATIASIIEILNNGMNPPPLSALLDGNGPTNGQVNGHQPGDTSGKGKPGTGRRGPKSSGPAIGNYLKITVIRWKDDNNKLEFLVEYHINGKISILKNFKKVTLFRDIKTYYDFNLNDLEENKAPEVQMEEYIHRLSMHFYDELFPYDLRKLIWKLRNKISTLIIDSFDESIAWEYCKMSGRDTNGIVQNGPFLCEWFNVVRSFTDTLKEKISLREMGVISPNCNLKNAHTEREMLFKLTKKRDNINVNGIIASVQDVITAFKSGKYTGIHFIGHSNSHGYANKFRLELDNGDITPEYLSGDTSNLGQAQPFVFLNSCYSGETGVGLTGAGGWAAAFLKAGASCFIGSTRAINDELALKFATSFYQYLFDDYTVAEAIRCARLDIKLSGDPSWLYYVVYAHPFAKLE